MFYILAFLSFSTFLWIVHFFRDPVRMPAEASGKIVCPADGKVVVIEKTTEQEYFKDERIQISIFMSPLNVHVNRYPVSGDVVYMRHHHGKYLVAWHPKSSTENERVTTVIKQDDGSEVLVRQIAGIMARRIIPYAEEGKKVRQGDELGFIRFGSRVDLFLPLNAKLDIKIEDMVKGNLNTIGTLG